MRRFNQLMYGVFALAWVALGIGALLALQPGEHPAEEIHLAREFGAGAVFVGFMHGWCLANYQRRLAVHVGLMVFAAAFAAIHWNDWIAGSRSLASPLLNSLPLALLAVMLRDGRGPKLPRARRAPSA